MGLRLMGSWGGGRRQVGCRAASRPAILKIELSLCQWADESRILPDSHKSRHPSGTAQPQLRLRVPPPVWIAPVRRLAASRVQSSSGRSWGYAVPGGCRAASRPAILKIELALCLRADESRILSDSHKSWQPPGTAQPQLRLRVLPQVWIAPVRRLATSLVQSALEAQLGLRGPRGCRRIDPLKMWTASVAKPGSERSCHQLALLALWSQQLNAPTIGSVFITSLPASLACRSPPTEHSDACSISAVMAAVSSGCSLAW